MSDNGELDSVDLPADVLDKIEQRVRYTEFEDKTAYITYLLEEVLYELEEDADDARDEAVDEAQVEERLKSLGYLNE